MEAAFDLNGILVSPLAYADLLCRLHAFHVGFEAAAERHLGETSFAPSLRRSDALRRDLAALGCSPRDASLPVPAYAGRVEALGGLYVVEGSLLGGLVIARAVERRLGFRPDTGSAFFAGHGRDTARNWLAFTAALDASVDPADHGNAVAAALSTFAAMETCLVAGRPRSFVPSLTLAS